MPPEEDEIGSLERARARLYANEPLPLDLRTPLSDTDDRVLPHEWEANPLPANLPPPKRRPLRIASIFFSFAAFFFVVSLGIAGYLLYFGGNTFSVDKISFDVQGPTTINSSDTVPILLTITNRNPVTLKNATIEIAFPDSTRDATNVLQPYPRYTENLGEIASGAVVTRSLKAVIFGGAGQTLALPVSLSYTTAGSNAVFVKKTPYNIKISSTPLEVSVGTVSESVSGKPITLTLIVRSNASVPLDNVVLASTFPFGFSVTSSSIPMSNSSFLLGTMAPGTTKTVSITGTLSGQESDQKVFRFNVGTAKSAGDQALAVTYMTQEAKVAITAPFINATLSVNGDSSPNVAVSAGSTQTIKVSYTNTLTTSVSNVNISVAVSGGAVDYESIETTRGFYNSLDKTVIFSQDKDSSLASLAPGASGTGTFTFSTLKPGTFTSAPTITFVISISGTRVGQSNVPEAVQSTVTKTAKVISSATLAASTLHNSGPIANNGPIPPVSNQATTYTVVWVVKNPGSTVADGEVSTTLPSYVTYTGKTTGVGAFSYDSGSRKVSWKTGDLVQGASAQGNFQVSIIPSTSQKGNVPNLTSNIVFSGYDRFAGAAITATADPVTTETPGDPGYVSDNGTVQ